MGHETILGRGGAPAGVKNACHWLVRHKHKRPAMEHEPGQSGEAKVLPNLLGSLQTGANGRFGVAWLEPEAPEPIANQWG